MEEERPGLGRKETMRRKFIGVAFVALAAVLAGSAQAQDKKVTIGVSIPAADHGWTAGAA